MAAREYPAPCLILLVLFSCVGDFTLAQVLTPPYFNLGSEREIYASSTCGEDVADAELFCRLTGATGAERGSIDGSKEIIQGQYCDFCDPSIQGKAHPPEYAIDGTERWWQSPPLSRGMRYNEVNLTINFGQEFHVAYVFIKMANSPRPGVWSLERSTDFGQTWQPWQYFADTPSDCYKFFNTPADREIIADDTVICTTEFSKVVPLENGEIVVSLVNNRPNALNFSNADILHEWTKATNVRMRLLRTKTLLGHLMAVARQDPTVTRRYFYSIKDISIGGRCVCNGHADTCDRADVSNPNLLVCECQHNTCGSQCEYCCPGYVQKKWQPARGGSENFVCEPCECYGHANECIYDEEVDRLRQSIDIYGRMAGGGVCQNCRDNTMGNNCDQCVPGYYRPYGVPRNRTDACRQCVCDLTVSTGECEEGSGRCLCRPEYTGELCDRCSPGYYGYPNCIPCECNINGTEDGICTVGGGQCPCKENFVGRRCDMCNFGYYNFPECKPCQCTGRGSVGNKCDVETGQCPCETNYGGQQCDQCADGYFNYPTCSLCTCQPTGTETEICNKDTGECLCKTNFQFPQCDRCSQGFYNYPTCQECQCAEPGSLEKICREDGQCPCRGNFAGLTCGRCHPGYFRYPDCKPCSCDIYGSIGQSCDQVTGQCVCRPTFQGLQCSKCKQGFYNYPMCEECNCNPAGAKEIPGYPLGGCGEVIKGQLCECKERVMGRICDKCKNGYYNLDRNNPLGCDECMCHAPGTISGLNMCNPVSGQCACKPDVTGRMCDSCQDGFYGLSESNPFGCIPCGCDEGGSVSATCNKRTGQCPCKPRVRGRRCEIPDTMHFFPTLQQFIYELEDGVTPEGSSIRYGFDTEIFPDFSWRGYAILTAIQPEVVMDVQITKPSLYRLIYRFINVNDRNVRGEVTLKPQSLTSDTAQMSEVFFPPSTDPGFVTVGSAGSQYDFVLNPGRWMISIKTDDIMLLDYMVLVPQAYYEATVLQQTVTRPCTVPNDPGPCILYNYPDLGGFPTVNGENGYTIDADQNQTKTQVFTDKIILNELGLPALAKLDKNQKDLYLNIRVPRPGRYVLVVNYYALSNRTQDLDVNVRTQAGETRGNVLLYSCSYSVLCRQVMRDPDNMPSIINITDSAEIYIRGDDDVDVAIGSVVAIPYDTWSLGYIRPNIICIRINGICIGSGYSIPVGSIRIDFEDPPNEGMRVKEGDLPPNILDSSTGLVRLNGSNPFIEIQGYVRAPGPYVSVVHFYLPTEVGMTMPVTVLTDDGQEFKGIFRPQYCPGVSGCRGIISFEGDNRNILNLQEGNIMFRFNNTEGKDIWVDYVMLVPARQYSVTDLNLQPIDNSANFLTQCIGPGFELISNSEFCLNGTFTITTDFNNGAVACNCDTDGSLSFDCSDFGGQCKCRENVIGRKCTHCREGYFGFPRCRRCNCPYGMCHPVTGDCMCPPRVTGDSCDQCMPATYGYDPLVGCTDCNCNQDGVENGELNCDQTTGQCKCKPGVGGRKCEYCLPGFHTFPLCSACSNCDSNGAMESICDALTGQCLCKDNVAEPDCRDCEPGSFYLNPMNPKGCTKCFCFGVTTACGSSDLVWEEFQDMSGWGITNAIEGSLREGGDTIAVLEARSKVVDEAEPMYWTAPSSYLGDKVTSYGGKLKFTSIYINPRDDGVTADRITRPAIILVGDNVTLHLKYSINVAPSRSTDVEVELIEYNFVLALGGSGVSREQFMMALVNLQAIHIQANHFTPTDEVRLINARLEHAIVKTAVDDKTDDDNDDGGGFFGFFFGGDGDSDNTQVEDKRAYSVEQCQCPRGYMGSSCQSCAEGYYRSTRSPYLGACVPCECYGHSNKCDSETGQCLNCTDNTMGRHCELCLPGHYGDATTGVCQICSCPLPIPGNNFASRCDVISGQVISCDCQEGYTGQLCDRCSPGYYGDPRTVGEICRSCQCSGNIDTRDPYACDLATGECLRCLNNTTGPNCAYCQEWFHGDAVNAKDCRSCDCDQCGSSSCDRDSGTCTCKPNVVGPTCSQCAVSAVMIQLNLIRMVSTGCNGCRDCNCGAASVQSQCDDNGQCTCQPGVTGRACDMCIEGYWNYGPSGCQECQCEDDGAITCNNVTGRCQCLPGVVGDRCDRCAPRWVLVPNRGCQECDSCVHILLDDVEVLERNISRLSINLESVSIGVTAFKRLEDINNTVYELRPHVDDLLSGAQDIALGPLQEAVRELQTEADDGKFKSESVAGDGENTVNVARTLFNEAYNTDALANDTNAQALGNRSAASQRCLENVEKGIQVTNIETYITQSEMILNEILNFSLIDAYNRTEREHELTFELLAKLRILIRTPENQMNKSRAIMKSLADIQRRLYDLQQETRHSTNDADDADYIIERLKTTALNLLKAKLGSIDMTNTDINMVLDMSRKLLDDALEFLRITNATRDEVEAKASSMDQALKALRNFVGNITNGIQDAEKMLNESQVHAKNLKDQADFLEKYDFITNVYTDTRDTAANALKAAQAYQNIVDAIIDAYNASTSANSAADQALAKSNGVGNRTKESKETSSSLLEAARDRYGKTKQDLAIRLDDAKRATDEVERQNSNVRDDLELLKRDMNNLQRAQVSARANAAANKADRANQRALDARAQVAPVLSKLPQDRQKIERLANAVAQTNRDVYDATNQNNYVKDSLPKIRQLIDLIGEKASSVDTLKNNLLTNLTRLREQITIAREAANRIRVGMEFLGNTTVQLRNPENVDQAGSYTTLSMYIQTRQQNAMLAYVGAEMIDGRPTSPDHMALELRNGRPVFLFDLGSGQVAIPSTRDVSDGQWYKITAQRIGKVGTLTVEGDPEKGIPKDIVSGESGGTYTVLELNPVTTRFYMGGTPSDFRLPAGVTSIFYEGIMEQVEFDDKPMGLWNFVYGENNYLGATERDVMKTVVSNGFRFNGKGYVILSARRLNVNSKESDIILDFKTYAEDGLILFMGKGRDFTSIEIRKGKILFQYDLGGMPAKLMSNKTYNDGKWHKIQAQREARRGGLTIDGTLVTTGESPGTLTDMSFEDDVFIGGYNQLIVNVNGVNSRGFDGCIRNVQFGTNIYDLNINKGAKGVVRGCPEQILRTASFSANRNGYIKLPLDSIGENFDMTFRLKTKSDSSLIAYTSSNNQNSGFSVSTKDGKIIIISDSGNDPVVLESTVNTYNDGAWHYISIMKMGVKLMINIDDRELITKPGSSSAYLLTERELYLGGTDFTVEEDLVGSSDRFVGCVSDVTVNGKFKNFASVVSRNVKDVSFSECPVEDPDTPTPTEAPIIDTTEPVGPTPLPQCALPSSVDVSAISPGPEDGIQFGLTQTSRYEYPTLGASLRVKFLMSMEIKTTSSSGVIFYAADGKHKDFTALILIDGHIMFKFDCGTGAAVLKSPKTYNDGQWHKIDFGRNTKSGTMNIDGEEVASGESIGVTRSLNVVAPLFLGGLSIDVLNNDRAKNKNLNGVFGSFIGCIKNMKFYNDDFGNPSNKVNTDKCTQNLETGTFFNSAGGYVELYKNYGVGLDLSIRMSIRPRNNTGVLFSIHADDMDFLLLQMVNGRILLSADNGGGAFDTTYDPGFDTALCDGQWHEIEAIKAKEILILRVDGVNSTPGQGTRGSSEINSNHPLYIGGVPDFQRRGMLANRNFNGCIRDVALKRGKEPAFRPQYVMSDQITGDVTINKCPVN
ncbi:hypothetical protein FSP39_021617 [Pinctada imbricata]|uniref:Laminin subunit alpha n=1 Tax=Pinctada imbricata TaxID=66713 RepID=A0AA89BQI5_PINIB|nr:hypothetical protein FSP39_021617 [Pinctada imbricata]